MAGGKWFSAKLRFAVLVEPEGADTLNDCIFVFRARGFPSAFSKAIRIGEAQQAKYRNVFSQQVFWKFMEVLTLDVIGARDLDGAEVHSEPIHLKRKDIIPFGSKFHPSRSKPIQTI